MTDTLGSTAAPEPPTAPVELPEPMELPQGFARASGYWYGSQEDTVEPVELLNLLRRYRETEVRMRGRVRDEMGMGEKDLLALRLLLGAQSRGEILRQKDLAAQLDITAASASAMVDRLVRDGYVDRVPHPDDRRSFAIVPTAHGDQEVRSTLQAMHQRMYAVAESLAPDERVAVAKFLRGVNDSLG